MTITRDELDLTIQGPTKPRPPLDMGHPLVVTSGGHGWKPSQTCSLEDPHHC